jgi:hypothetical protein
MGAFEHETWMFYRELPTTIIVESDPRTQVNFGGRYPNPRKGDL